MVIIWISGGIIIMFRARPPAQLFERIISKGTKGLEELEGYLKQIAAEMMKEGQPEHISKEVWGELDALICFFMVRKQPYITNELHRAYLVQSLELLGFTLDECRQVNKYFEPIAKTILSFFTDASEKVKLAAVGAMYNLLNKYLQQGREFFIEIFERLTVLIADASGQIRQAATFLNKALKTMVYDTIFDQTALNLKAFVQILAERLQTGGNLAKEFMLDWLTTIEEVPQFEISNDLPLFFRQVFELFLSTSKSLKTKAEDCLKKFLYVFREILSVEGKLSSKLTNESAQMILEMTLLLVRQNLSSDITLNALEWLELFTKFLSLEIVKGFDPFLEPIYSFMLKDIILVVISTMSDDSDRIRKIASRTNDALLSVFPKMKVQKKSIEKASQLLQGLLSQGRVSLRVEATLRWIKFFFLNYKSEYLNSHVNRIMELIIQKLCDRMATKSLYQLLQDSLFIVSYYDLLVQTFLSYLCDHDRIPMEPIFKQILSLKNAENHFLAIIKKIQMQKNIVFQYHLIESVITVLVSESALENLRMKISKKEDSHLFVDLFKRFSMNQPAALILCFLAGKYYLAKEFIQMLASEERLCNHNFRSLIRMSNLVEHSNMNHIRSDLRSSETAVKAYLSLLMALPYGKCSSLLLQRLPPQMPRFGPEMLDEEEKRLADTLLKEYLSLHLSKKRK